MKHLTQDEWQTIHQLRDLLQRDWERENGVKGNGKLAIVEYSRVQKALSQLLKRGQAECRKQKNKLGQEVTSLEWRRLPNGSE